MVDRAHRPDVTSSVSNTGGGNGPISDSRVGTTSSAVTAWWTRSAGRDGERPPGPHGRPGRLPEVGGHQERSTRTSCRTSRSSRCSSTRRASPRISHPNVATVFEVGQHERTYWIAMEYLHGEPLRGHAPHRGDGRTDAAGDRVPRHRRRGRGAPLGARARGEERRAAPGRAPGRDAPQPVRHLRRHDQGRRLRDRQVRLAHVEHARGHPEGQARVHVPEQVHGEALDRRTDIFALGVVLWELTTGQRLFRMESDLDTLAKVQECAVPRPSSLVRGYPIDLEKIVMKTLAKNRGERFRPRASCRAPSSRCSCGAAHSSSRATRSPRTPSRSSPSASRSAKRTHGGPPR